MYFQAIPASSFFKGVSSSLSSIKSFDDLSFLRVGTWKVLSGGIWSLVVVESTASFSISVSLFNAATSFSTSFSVSNSASSFVGWIRASLTVSSTASSIATSIFVESVLIDALSSSASALVATSGGFGSKSFLYLSTASISDILNLRTFPS